MNADAFPSPLHFLFTSSFHEPRYLLPWVVQAYRWYLTEGDQPLSFARFAQALSQGAPQLNLCLSPQTIKNWEKGVHCPDFFFTLRLMDQAPVESWQHAFAMDILAVQWPLLYPPGSEIGIKLVKALLEA